MDHLSHWQPRARSPVLASPTTRWISPLLLWDIIFETSHWPRTPRHPTIRPWVDPRWRRCTIHLIRTGPSRPAVSFTASPSHRTRPPRHLNCPSTVPHIQAGYPRSSSSCWQEGTNPPLRNSKAGITSIHHIVHPVVGEPSSVVSRCHRTPACCLHQKTPRKHQWSRLPPSDLP